MHEAGDRGEVDRSSYPEAPGNLTFDSSVFGSPHRYVTAALLLVIAVFKNVITAFFKSVFAETHTHLRLRFAASQSHDGFSCCFSVNANDAVLQVDSVALGNRYRNSHRAVPIANTLDDYLVRSLSGDGFDLFARGVEQRGRIAALVDFDSAHGADCNVGAVWEAGVRKAHPVRRFVPQVVNDVADYNGIDKALEIEFVHQDVIVRAAACIAASLHGRRGHLERASVRADFAFDRDALAVPEHHAVAVDQKAYVRGNGL